MDEEVLKYNNGCYTARNYKYMNIYIETKKQNKEKCLLSEIIEIIKNNKGLEEIWISSDTKKYPCLVIHFL